MVDNMTKDEPYVFEDLTCKEGVLYLKQWFINVITYPCHLWRRVRAFKGTVITIQKYPYSDSHNWACTALLLQDGKKRKWHECCLYPYTMVKPGEKVKRSFLGRIYVIRNGEEVKLIGSPKM